MSVLGWFEEVDEFSRHEQDFAVLEKAKAELIQKYEVYYDNFCTDFVLPSLTQRTSGALLLEISSHIGGIIM